MIYADKNQEIQDGKIFAMLGYWCFLCILPLILKKENNFAVYHGKQGLVLFIFLVGGFLLNIIPVLGQMIWRLTLFIYLTLFIWGTIQALTGKYGRIPIISNIADKIVI